MVTIKELKQKCKKEEYWGAYNRLIHEIGFYFTLPFVNTPITSNQVTIFWLMLGLIGGFLLSTGEYRWMLLGIIIYHLGHFFDCVDGDLARFRNKSSLKGIYLEQISHHLTIISILVGLTVGVFQIFQNLLWLYAGGVLVGSFVLAKLFSINLSSYKGEARQRIAEIIDKSNPRQNNIISFIFALIRVEHPLNILFWMILADLAHLALFLYMILFFAEMCRQLVNNLIQLQRLDAMKK